MAYTYTKDKTMINITANLNHPQVEAAVQYLASLDTDHATTQNGVGFNGRDTDFGCSIAASSKIKRLSDKQHEGIIKTLWRYNNTQLQPAGYIIPTLGDLQLWLKERERLHPYVLPARVVLPNTPVSMGAVVLVDGELSVTMPKQYFRWVKAIKTIVHGDRLVAKYHPTENNRWTLPLDWLDRLLLVCPQTDFVYDPVLLQTQAETQKRQALAAEEREIAAARRELQVRKLMKVAQLDAPLSNGWLLHEHQKTAVEFVFNCGGKAIIGDQMGLGKTTSSLKAAKAYQDLYGADIICIVPISLIDNWYKEARYTGCRIQVVGQTAGRIPKPASITKPTVVITDECHAFKNLSSQRTKAWLALCASPHLIANLAMSGTPIKNGAPSDLFPILKGLGHALGKSKSAFENRYGFAHQGFLRELHQILTVEDPIMIRRTKEEVLQLPPFSREMIEGELTSEDQRVYDTTFKRLQREYNDRVSGGEISAEGWELVLLNHLRHAGSTAKINTVVNLALQFLEGEDGLEGEQVVIFTVFKDTAFEIQRRLQIAGFIVDTLTGDTRQQDRDPMVQRFQTKQTDVMVCMAQAGGVGITLTAASKVILADRDWTLSSQAESRIDRIGQNKPTTAFWVRHTLVDLFIDNKLIEKEDTSDLILQGFNNGIQGIAWNDEARNLLATIFNGGYSIPVEDETEPSYLPAYNEEF
jgi:superfamily II DNA or RNA helicase